MLSSSESGGRCKLRLHQEIPRTSVRCSGGFVRDVLFTGTAAQVDSKLVLSTTKTGMTTNIPAR